MHKVIQKAQELQEALKEFDYVEDVDVDIYIHRDKNYVHTVEKAVKIVDEIFGEHKSKVLSQSIAVEKRQEVPKDRVSLTIFLDDTEENKNAVIDEGFDEVVEEVNGDVKTGMS